MGMSGLSWTPVATFLAEFWGSPIISTGIAAVIGIAIGGVGLRALVNAFWK